MRKLWVQMAGAFVLVALLATAAAAVVISQAIDSSFRGYLQREVGRAASVQLTDALEAHYASAGSWEGASAALPGAGRAGGGRGMGSGMAQNAQGAGPMGGARYTVFDADGAYVAGNNEQRGSGDASLVELATSNALTVDGQTVGWLLVEAQSLTVLSEAQADFLAQVRRTMAWAGLLAGAVALVVGLLASQVIARPLHGLTRAAGAVAAGQLGTQAPLAPRAPEEIQTLQSAFNQMSRKLEKSETQRRRLTADVAHELRTPLSVMRGQLQAMLDKLHPADEAHIAVVYDQTLHLARLVDDLHTLTRAESGHLPLNKQPVDPGTLLKEVAAMFELLAQDAGLALRLDVPGTLPGVSGDGDRLKQVLANLLANALRHTESGGYIRLAAAPSERGVMLTVANSGETLTAEQAERVFDRFWRADESRQRDRGGAGLGLAIAREIVTLHGGDIQVAVGGGETAFHITLPAA